MLDQWLEDTEIDQFEADRRDKTGQWRKKWKQILKCMTPNA